MVDQVELLPVVHSSAWTGRGDGFTGVSFFDICPEYTMLRQLYAFEMQRYALAISHPNNTGEV